MGPELEHAVLRLQNLRPVGRAELPERPEEHGGLLLIREARQALVFRRAPEAQPQRLGRGPDEMSVVVPLQNGRDGAARSGWCRRLRRRSQGSSLLQPGIPLHHSTEFSARQAQNNQKGPASAQNPAERRTPGAGGCMSRRGMTPGDAKTGFFTRRESEENRRWRAENRNDRSNDLRYNRA